MVAVEGKLSPRILGGNGVAAGTTNYPGAATHTGSGRSGFRGVEHSDGLGSTPIPLNIYYDAGWQAVETRTNGTAATDVTSQMVWSAAYINAAILQDTYSAGVIQPNGRLYYLQDADWNVTALITFDSGTNTWAVSERFVFDSYGNAQTFNANWQAATDRLSWQVLAQGRFRDLTTGLDDGRARIYSASLGRWVSEDPAGYINGASTYQYEVGGPVGSVDPRGLKMAPIPGVYYCKAYKIGHYVFKHAFIEVGGNEYGLFPANESSHYWVLFHDVFWLPPGVIHFNDSYSTLPTNEAKAKKAGDKVYVKRYSAWIDDCEVDPKKAAKMIAAIAAADRKNPPGYNWLLANCAEWAYGEIYKGVRAAAVGPLPHLYIDYRLEK